jgi:hypothetical protein
VRFSASARTNARARSGSRLGFKARVYLCLGLGPVLGLSLGTGIGSALGIERML